MRLIHFQTKGQINVEYFAALILFLTFTIYFAFLMSDMYPEHLRNIKEEILRADAYRLSEMLINDDGEPTGWPDVATANVKRIGLGEGSLGAFNILNTSKVLAFGGMCTNPPDTVKDLVGYEHNFFILINSTAPDTIPVECGALPPFESIVVIRRVVAFDDGYYGTFILYTWW